MDKEKNSSLTTQLFFALIPLILLAGVIYVLLSGGPTKIFQTDIPPIEKLHVLRHTLEKDTILLDCINSGPDAVTIAQVMVRGAFWYHEISPKRTLNPLETARVLIPYPWNPGEPVGIVLLTSTGLTFDYEIEVASLTPKPSMVAFGRFAMIGVYVGLIPVALGICWFPFLRRLGKRGVGFFLYLTVGLLAFLVFDAVTEGLKIAENMPSNFHGPALLALGLAGAYLVLIGIETRIQEKRGGLKGGILLAWLIALGIGLHNLGEGLAIGSAYVIGELTLGAMLVIGFTIHNATEGIAIVVPLLKEQPKLPSLIGLGLLAGGPTILGCWIGAFTYSQAWSLLFLGIGAGAILQVIFIIMGRQTLSETLSLINIFAMIVGYFVMYGTSLLVGAS